MSFEPTKKEVPVCAGYHGAPAELRRAVAILGTTLASLVSTGCAGPAPGAPPPVTTARPAPAVGIHGMVVFGHDRLYASHLPLYQCPHDWQVILEVEPADAAVAHALAAELTRSLVTFMPDSFDLTRLAPDAPDPVRELTGSLYAGHFERGGTVAHAGVHLRVRSVLVFRHLEAGAARAPARWLAFGSAGEAYLVHALGGRPEVDAIVAVAGPAPAEGVTSLEVAERTAEGIPAEGWITQHGWRAPRVIYREDGDLR